MAAVLCVLTSTGSIAHAQPDLAAAGEAFEQAQAAERAGDWSTAARLHERADRIAPAPEALRSALRARLKAGELALAGTHALELLRRYPTHDITRELAQSTIDQVANKVVRLDVQCDPVPCALQVDGRAFGTEARRKHNLFLDSGSHGLVAMFGSKSAPTKTLDGGGGERIEMTFVEPAASSSATGDSTGSPSDGRPPSGQQPDDGAFEGIHPGWFVAGSLVTVALGAATIWSGMNVVAAKKDYVATPSKGAYDDGVGRERRTNILIASTAVAGAATLVFAIITDWSSDDTTSEAALIPTIAPTDNGIAASWTTRF